MFSAHFPELVLLVLLLVIIGLGFLVVRVLWRAGSRK